MKLKVEEQLAHGRPCTARSTVGRRDNFTRRSCFLSILGLVSRYVVDCIATNYTPSLLCMVVGVRKISTESCGKNV
jgi:hypothetical protein